MSKILYVELATMQEQPDPEARGGFVRAFVSSGKCAVFDEKEFDGLIRKTERRLRDLRKLRHEAETHSRLIEEEYLKASYGVPFTVKVLVKKKC